MIKSAGVQRAATYKSEVNKTKAEHGANTKLQAQIVKLNSEVEGLAKQRNMDEVSAAEKKKQVLSEIAKVQAEVNVHQAEAVEQAKMKQVLSEIAKVQAEVNVHQAE